jgi:hypothetical protein
MLDHWEPLTLFLRVAGAPLDNTLTTNCTTNALMHTKVNPGKQAYS